MDVFKRLIWFSSGAVSGAAGSWYVKRRIQEKIQEKVDRFTPQGMREQAIAKAKSATASAKAAASEGRRLAEQYRSEPT